MYIYNLDDKTLILCQQSSLGQRIPLHLNQNTCYLMIYMVGRRLLFKHKTHLYTLNLDGYHGQHLHRYSVELVEATPGARLSQTLVDITT